MSLWGFSTRRKKPAARAASRRARRGRNRLGAIVEEHLEYEVPAELERYFFSRGRQKWAAFCYPNVEPLLADVESTVPESVKNDPKGPWAPFAWLIRRETKELKDKEELQRAPPVCILRPKGTKEATPSVMKSMVKHERFHARAETLRRAYGVGKVVDNAFISRDLIISEADKQLVKDFGKPAKDAIRLAKAMGWTTPTLDNTEEILARVEEIIEDCSYEGDAQTCGLARSRISNEIEWHNKGFIWRYPNWKPSKAALKNPIDPDSFNKLVEAVEAYGSTPSYYSNLLSRVLKRPPMRVPVLTPRVPPPKATEPPVVSPVESKVPPAPRLRPKQEEQEEPEEPKKKKPVETQKWIDDDGQEWEVIVKPKRGKKKLAGASWWRKGLRA